MHMPDSRRQAGKLKAAVRTGLSPLITHFQAITADFYGNIGNGGAGAVLDNAGNRTAIRQVKIGPRNISVNNVYSLRIIATEFAEDPRSNQRAVPCRGIVHVWLC